MWRIVVALALLQLAAATAPPPMITYQPKALLKRNSAAQSLWASQNFGQYGYQFNLGVQNSNGASSFLAIEVPLVTIQVLNGTITSVQTPDLGMPVNPALQFDQAFNRNDTTFYAPIEQFYTAITYFLSQPSLFHFVNLTYDPFTGMPLLVVVDYDDAGLTFQFSLTFSNLVTFSAKKPMQPLPNLYSAANEFEWAFGNLSLWENYKFNYGLEDGYAFTVQVLSTYPQNLPCTLCTVFVANNTVINVLDQNFNLLEPQLFNTSIHTIDNVFAQILNFTTVNSTVTVDAHYDPIIGYPLWVLLTSTTGTADQIAVVHSGVIPCNPAMNCSAVMIAFYWGLPALANIEIESAVELWTTQGYSGKSYTVDFFNSGAPSTNTTLTVKNGNVVAVYDTIAKAYLNQSAWFDFYKSVDATLATLLYVNSQPEVRVHVLFDAKTGLPYVAQVLQYPVVAQVFAYSNLKKTGLSGGQVFGIVFGVLVGVALLVGVAVFLVRRNRVRLAGGYTHVSASATSYGSLNT